MIRVAASVEYEQTSPTVKSKNDTGEQLTDRNSFHGHDIYVAWLTVAAAVKDCDARCVKSVDLNNRHIYISGSLHGHSGLDLQSVQETFVQTPEHNNK